MYHLQLCGNPTQDRVDSSKMSHKAKDAPYNPAMASWTPTPQPSPLEPSHLALEFPDLQDRELWFLSVPKLLNSSAELVVWTSWSTMEICKSVSLLGSMIWPVEVVTVHCNWEARNAWTLCTSVLFKRPLSLTYARDRVSGTCASAGGATLEKVISGRMI
jgi:hypothetical protein